MQYGTTNTSIHGRTDVYETNVISAPMAALIFSTGGVFLRQV